MGARRRQLGGIDRLPSGRWRARLVDPSTGRRISLGTFKTKADAERAFASATTDQQKGAWVAPEKGRVTLDDYAWQWLETRLTRKGERLRPKTRQLYAGFLRLHILPTLGSAPLARLTTSGIRSGSAESACVSTRPSPHGPGNQSMATPSTGSTSASSDSPRPTPRLRRDSSAFQTFSQSPLELDVTDAGTPYTDRAPLPPWPEIRFSRSAWAALPRD